MLASGQRNIKLAELNFKLRNLGQLSAEVFIFVLKLIQIILKGVVLLLQLTGLVLKIVKFNLDIGNLQREVLFIGIALGELILSALHLSVQVSRGINLAVEFIGESIQLTVGLAKLSDLDIEGFDLILLVAHLCLELLQLLIAGLELNLESLKSFKLSSGVSKLFVQRTNLVGQIRVVGLESRDLGTQSAKFVLEGL